jgi:hypothetical protein
VSRETSLEVSKIWVVSAPISTPKTSWRVLTAMMISSIEVLPARSPIPLMAPSIWRAPA